MTYQLEKSVWFPYPAEEVFLYHACMENICKLIPNDIKLKVLAAPCNIKLGDKIRLRVALFPLYFLWEAQITEYVYADHFTDTVLCCPFTFWRHRHIFKAHEGGTLMTDRVEYSLPLGVLGIIAQHVFVHDKLDYIFTTRHKKALEHFRGGKIVC